MTVDSFYYPEVYANDSDVVYTFEIESKEGAIEIWKNDGTTRTQLVEGEHYALAFEDHLDPTYKRGKCVLAAPLAEGSWLEVFRRTPIVDEFEPVAYKPFPTEELEANIDKICYIQQEIEGHYCACDDYPELPEPPEEPPEEPPPPPPPPTLFCDSFLRALDTLDDVFAVYDLTTIDYTVPQTHFPNVLGNYDNGDGNVFDYEMKDDTDEQYKSGSWAAEYGDHPLIEPCGDGVLKPSGDAFFWYHNPVFPGTGSFFECHPDHRNKAEWSTISTINFWNVTLQSARTHVPVFYTSGVSGWSFRLYSNFDGTNLVIWPTLNHVGMGDIQESIVLPADHDWGTLICNVTATNMDATDEDWQGNTHAYDYIQFAHTLWFQEVGSSTWQEATHHWAYKPSSTAVYKEQFRGFGQIQWGQSHDWLYFAVRHKGTTTEERDILSSALAKNRPEE